MPTATELPHAQQDFLAALLLLLEPDERIRALFLSGSFGRGTADAWSDVDLIAITAPEHRDALMEGWRARLETIAPIVFFNRLPWAPVLNAITEDWLRIDLQLSTPDDLRGQAQDRYQVLFDRDGIFAALPPTAEIPATSPAKLLGIVTEFIRILGLLHVADGRREYELATTGTGMMRGLLTNLLIEEMQRGDQGGMLHLSRKIDAPRMQLLLDLPVAEPDRASVIAANSALARAFFPRAKAFGTQLGMEWPESFETATRRKLQQAVPDGDWNW